MTRARAAWAPRLLAGLVGVMGVMGVVSAGTALGAEPRRSGFDDMSPGTQALQRDDTQNPAMLWVQDGEQRFNADCKRCHEPGNPAQSLRGAAARHPAWDAQSSRPLTLAGRINQCRVRHVKAPALPLEGEGLLALEAYVALQSRGQPIAPDRTPALLPYVAQGERLFKQRVGQLDFSCAQCHDDNAGRRLAGALIPQAHPNGYPIYRLEWQGLGSLQRRLRNCMSGVRAEPYAYGSEEFTMIELYLKQRAAGMVVESPAVRP